MGILISKKNVLIEIQERLKYELRQIRWELGVYFMVFNWLWSFIFYVMIKGSREINLSDIRVAQSLHQLVSQFAKWVCLYVSRESRRLCECINLPLMQFSECMENTRWNAFDNLCFIVHVTVGAATYFSCWKNLKSNWRVNNFVNLFTSLNFMRSGIKFIL